MKQEWTEVSYAGGRVKKHVQRTAKYKSKPSSSNNTQQEAVREVDELANVHVVQIDDDFHSSKFRVRWCNYIMTVYLRPK